MLRYHGRSGVTLRRLSTRLLLGSKRLLPAIGLLRGRPITVRLVGLISLAGVAGCRLSGVV